MAYIPTLSDIQQLEGQSQNQSQGYQPTLADIQELNNVPNSVPAKNSFLANIAADTGSGLSEGLQNLTNLLGANIVSDKLGVKQPTTQNWNDLFGVQNPGLTDKIVQGAASYLPFGGIGKGLETAGMVPEFLNNLPKVGNYLSKFNSQMIPGALYGASQNQSPVSSQVPSNSVSNIVSNLGNSAKSIGYGAAGALGNLGGGVIGDALSSSVSPLINAILPTDNSTNAIKNSIVSFLNNRSQKFGNLTPEEAAQNVSSNYTNPDGSVMNVDIGTATNNPLLKTVNTALNYVPFSGAAKNTNQLKNQIINKQIDDVQNQLQDATSGQTVAGQTLDYLNNQLTNVKSNIAQNTDTINQAPDKLNALLDNFGDKNKVDINLTNAVRNSYKDAQNVSNQNYAPINNSNIQFNPEDGENIFPNYSNAANDLLAKQENFTNLFGNDSDLGSKLKNELGKADSIINNSPDFSMTLPEGIQRLQTLGKLGAAAMGQGNNNEARLLNSLRDGLQTDIYNNLSAGGNGDMVQTLANANDFYKNNIVPYWRNNEIRKVSNYKMDPNYIAAAPTLSDALHDPNNGSILNNITPDAQNAALHQKITRGSGDSSGNVTLTPAQIGNIYQAKSFGVPAKRAIASYNPDMDNYLQQLSPLINQTKSLTNTQQDLEGQVNQINQGTDAQQTNADNLQKQLDNLQQKKFGVNNNPMASDSLLLKLLKGGAALGSANYLGTTGIPLALLGRRAASILSSPDLIKSYTSGVPLPVNPSTALSNLLPYLVTPTLSNKMQQGS